MVALLRSTRFGRTVSTIESLRPAVWLDFSDTSTIIESGGAVSQVQNKGHLGGYFTPNSTSPTTGTRTQNNMNVLDFDGTANSLVSSLPASAFKFLHDGTKYIVGVVYARDVAGVNGGIYTTGTGSTSIGSQFRQLVANTLSHFINSSGSGAGASTNYVDSADTSTATKLFTGYFDAGNATAANRAYINLDGAAQWQSNTVSGSLGSADPGSTLWIGNRSTSALPLDGTIAEVFMSYDPDYASDSGRSTLHTAMNTKWAVY